MFDLFHDNAREIVESVNLSSLRAGIQELGFIAKKATRKEMKRHKGLWTTDHWTGPNDETYSTTMFHYIKDWKMKSLVIDFKVFRGTTSGEAVFHDQRKVLQGVDDSKPFCLMGVTDTTGSMGTLGKYLREDGQEHGYCTDHNFYRNALLAFVG